MASSEEDGTNGASEASDEKEATGKRRRLGFLATAWLTFYNIAMTAGYVRAKVLPRSARSCAVPRRSGLGDAGSARSRGCWGSSRGHGARTRVERKRAGEFSGVEAEARDRSGGGFLWSESARVGQLGVAAQLSHMELGERVCPATCGRSSLGVWPGCKEQERECWALGGRGAAGARGAVGEGRSPVEWSGAGRPLAARWALPNTVHGVARRHGARAGG